MQAAMADDDDSSWESLPDHKQQLTGDSFCDQSTKTMTIASPLEHPVFHEQRTILDYDNNPLLWDELQLRENRLRAATMNSPNVAKKSVHTNSVVLEPATVEYESDWESLTTHCPSIHNHIGKVSDILLSSQRLHQDDPDIISTEKTQNFSAFLNNSKLHHSSNGLTRKKKAANSKLPLDVLCGNFVLHLLREVWCKSWQIQVASIITGLGVTCSSIRYTIWYAYSPRQMIGLILLFVPVTYLHQQSIHNTIDNLLQSFSDPSNVSKIVADFNPLNFRYGSIILMYILPISMEIWTLHILLVIHSDLGSHVLNLSVASLLLVSIFLNWMVWKRPLKICQEVLIWILYGSSLTLAIQHCHWYRIPQLAGPFLIPTGTLWLKDASRKNPDLLSQSIQGALRRSIRDAFDEVTTLIEKDEMFYLTMIRWIVDYWNVGGKQSETASQQSHSSTKHGRRKIERPIVTNTTYNEPSTTASTEESSIEWADMSKMLSLVTDQIEAEVEGISESNSSFGSNQSKQANQSTTESQRDPQLNRSSLHDLHRMFATMDLDEKMKPLIEEYNRKVKAIPPTREFATLLALSVRCPTILLFTWQVFFGTLGTLSSNAVVFVLIGFEVFRVYIWIRSCHTRSTQAVSIQGLINDIKNADAMKLLLLDESKATIGSTSLCTSVPTLLIVWYNVQHSVVALEKGLSTARCMQTVNASFDFALHLISLVNFGMEVSERGWLHGLSVIVQELTALHHRKHDDTMDHATVSRNTRVTSATIGTICSSQVLHRNLQIMLDEHVKPRTMETSDEMPNLPFDNCKKSDVCPDFLSIAKKSKWLATDAMEKSLQLHVGEALVDQTSEEMSESELKDDENGLPTASQTQESEDVQTLAKEACTPACDSVMKVQVPEEITDAESTLRQLELSEDFLSIAKKSRWLASDAIEKSIKLHVAD